MSNFEFLERLEIRAKTANKDINHLKRELLHIIKSCNVQPAEEGSDLLIVVRNLKSKNKKLKKEISDQKKLVMISNETNLEPNKAISVASGRWERISFF